MSGFRCQFCKGSLMKVHYPELYNMAHFFSLNVFTFIRAFFDNTICMKYIILYCTDISFVLEKHVSSTTPSAISKWPSSVPIWPYPVPIWPCLVPDWPCLIPNWPWFWLLVSTADFQMALLCSDLALPCSDLALPRSGLALPHSELALVLALSLHCRLTAKCILKK